MNAQNEPAPLRIHVKNNHAAPHTFPPTPEGEAVFTITEERFATAAHAYPDVAARIETCIDWDLDNFESSMRTAQVLVCWDLPTIDLARVAPKLRWIHIIGAGVEHLCPMDWLPPGVTVVNNRGAHADKGGEWGLMAILMLHNRMPTIMGNQHRAHWESLYSTPIAGRTLLIVGTGHIGASVARHGKALGLKVLGVSRHGAAMDCLDEAYTMAALDDLLPRADFVVMVTPLTLETHGMLDARRLGAMKADAGLINIGRGATVDYVALARLLESGHLGGAILDVFEQEPLPAGSPLWRAPNVIVTPHVSADDGDAYVPITLDLVFANLRRDLAGEPLANAVRPDHGY